MHFGAQSRGLRAPCERFAPWVTPGPRITRFRLAADLGRMGLVAHRVSNKVSKITSRHLVPLDRAFPAHALVHESGVRHLQRHVKEFEERHNARMADTLEQVELTMRRMIGRRLRYQDLVKGNGLKSGARAVAA